MVTLSKMGPRLWQNAILNNRGKIRLGFQHAVQCVQHVLSIENVTLHEKRTWRLRATLEFSQTDGTYAGIHECVMCHVSLSAFFEEYIVIVIHKYVSHDGNVGCHPLIKPGRNRMCLARACIGFLKIHEDVSFDITIATIQIQSVIRSAKETII